MTSKLTRDIIQSEIADFFAGVVEIHTELGGPNTVEEAQNQLTERVLSCVPAVDCEPVAVVEPSDYVTAAQLVGEGPARKAVHELYEGALRIGDKLYLHAQPAPVVPDGLLSMAASAIEDLLEHTDPNTSYYSGVWADVPGKLRAAMIAAAPQDEAKKDKPHNNFGTGARLTNHRFKV
ncbi:hypothetical protein ACPEF3_09650 [Klebsiella sp. K822]|uniref:hypothetical protein n=1 Tax=unclassified Klebsiella TaxID=2608929 RepID=UPI003C2FA2D6